MFDAHLEAVGKILKAVFAQGSLLFETYISTGSPDGVWFLFLLAACIVYPLLTLMIRRICL